MFFSAIPSICKDFPMVSYDFPMMFPLKGQESTQKGANGDANVSEDFLATW